MKKVFYIMLVLFLLASCSSGQRSKNTIDNYKINSITNKGVKITTGTIKQGVVPNIPKNVNNNDLDIK